MAEKFKLVPLDPDGSEGFKLTPLETEPSYDPNSLRPPPGYEEAQGETLIPQFEVDPTMVGGLAGTMAGAPLGPGGMIAGGAIGSGLGSAAGDWAKGDDVDLAKALTEAGISLGIDVATLGIGRLGKGIYNVIRSRAAQGASPEDIVRELARGPAGDFGTSQARMQSQEALQEEGLSLTPFQAGVASEWELQKENVARGAFFGKGVFENIQNKVSEIVKRRMSQEVGRGEVLPAEELGRHLSSVLDEGKDVIRQEYGRQLDQIGDTLSSIAVPVKHLGTALDNFVTKNSDSLGNPLLDKSTLKAIDDLKGLMSEVDTAPAKFLLEFDKHLNRKITEVSSFGSPSFNPTTAAELTSLSRRMKVRIRSGITSANPQAGRAYKQLQNTYRDDITTLFPDLNKSFVRNADKGVYSTLGRVFTLADKTENVQALMKSLDKAYGKMTQKELANLHFSSAQEAKDAIRASYIETKLGSFGSDVLDTRRFTQEAVNLTDKTKASKARAVLGDKYEGYKRLVNLIADASNKPESGLATLFQRSKEFAAAGGLAAAGATGAIGVGKAAITAGAVLGAPRVLAYMATSPKHVNKLIKLDQMGVDGKSAFEITEKATLLINDIVTGMAKDGLSEPEISKALGLE